MKINQLLKIISPFQEVEFVGYIKPSSTNGAGATQKIYFRGTAEEISESLLENKFKIKMEEFQNLEVDSIFPHERYLKNGDKELSLMAMIRE